MRLIIIEWMSICNNFATQSHYPPPPSLLKYTWDQSNIYLRYLKIISFIPLFHSVKVNDLTTRPTYVLQLLHVIHIGS